MSERDPLIQRLAEMNPVPLALVEGASTSPAADRALAEAVTGRRAPRRHIRRLAVVLACTLVGALAAAVTFLVLSDRSPATAAELLKEVAAIAAAGDAPDAGRYLYTRTVAEHLVTSDEEGGAWSVILPIVEETWIAPDGSGRIRSDTRRAIFPGPRDEDRWESAGEPEFPSGVADNTFTAGMLTYEDVSYLPTDPSELRAALGTQVMDDDPPRDVAVFLRIGALLGRGDASPQLRAALYRVASDLPGIELVGETIDPLGRQGVGVGMSYTVSGASVRVLMVFDKESSDLLAREQFLLQRASWIDVEPGSRVSFIAFTTSQRVMTTLDRSAPG